MRKKTVTTRKCVKPIAKDLRKELITKAIVDPRFRAKLLKDPQAILGKVTGGDKVALENMRKSLPALNSIIDSLSSSLLCGGGGGCPGLA